MSRVPVSRSGVLLLVLTTVLLGAACDDSDGGDDESREVVLSFDDGLESEGSADLDVTTVTAGGGSVEEESRDDGKALRLPEFAQVDPGLAGLAVVDTEGADDLAPGTSTFSFGAEFVLDEKSGGSPVDNGDNIVQRGLYGADSQYKLQVDRDQVSCRIKGAEGEVQVDGPEITPGEWYSATCTRFDSRVELEVVRLEDGETWTASANGATGEMSVSSRSLPLSVGVKINQDGGLMEKDSDQFNGMIDEVFLDIVR